LYVRIKPGDHYCTPRGKYYSLMPIPFDNNMIEWLRSQMTPNQWYVYCVLLKYEHIKLEEWTPGLDQIWEQDCDCMSKEEFDEAIQFLLDFLIDDERYGMILPLVKWEKEC
jgi:hypothetical protein